jgi:hypothetical protein
VELAARLGKTRPRLAARLSLAAKLQWVVGAILWGISTSYHAAPMPILIAGTTLIGVGFVAMLASWLLSLRLALKDGRVKLGDALELERAGKTITLRPSDIASAHAQAGGRVEITQTNGDEHVLELGSEEAATTLVERLGYGWGDKPVTYRFGSRFRRFFHFVVGYLAYQLGAMVGGLLGIGLAIALSFAFRGTQLIPQDALGAVLLPSMAFGVMLAYVLGKRLLSAPVVTVGNDGVRLETMGFRRRFLPIGDIVMVHQPAVHAPARIKLRDGTVIPMAGFLVDPPRRDAAASHIRALLARHAVLQRSITLAREGRSIKDWREHLRRVIEGSGYRIAASSDSLADLIAAPGLSAEERVGAALALRVAGDSNVPKIRIAADQCVDPKTRAALEAAAREEIDEQAIESALR